MGLKKRQREILQSLVALGGRATTREIATRTGLDVNGVSQSLGAMSGYVHRHGGKGGGCLWEIILGETGDTVQLRLVP